MTDGAATMTEKSHEEPRAVPETMDAITQDRYGEPLDVLSTGRVEVPTPAADEVLIEVAAAGVDQGTWHLVAGMPLVVRLGFGLRRPRNAVPGLDVSGTVVACGEDVADLEPGDAVFGIAKGSFAEYAVAKATKIAKRPDSLPALDAAGLAVSGITALQAIRDQARVSPGERVLVVGASGGVGSFAVQIAKSQGAEVVGVCSSEKVDFVRSLGADDVIDYRTESLDARGDGYDAIIDTGGAHPLRTLRGVLTERGRLVIVGAETGGKLIGGVDRQLRGMLLSMFSRQTIKTFISAEKGETMAVLAELVDRGEVRVAVGATRPLHEAPAAIDDMRSGRSRGKTVLTV